MDALNRRDFDAIADLPFDPEGEFRSAFAVAEGEVYIGVDGLRKWAENVDATWEDFHVELIEFHEVDEHRAVLVFHNTGRAKASGIPLDMRTSQVWTWRDGKVWRNDSFTDPDEAFRVVGLGAR